ncbi:hypothetical protein ABW21_db0206676 [Orbilia brochopaga]|nr:hypothetical protein ABW21_db0206676 [Drechslerella brochopaga]
MLTRNRGGPRNAPCRYLSPNPYDASMSTASSVLNDGVLRREMPDQRARSLFWTACFARYCRGVSAGHYTYLSLYLPTIYPPTGLCTYRRALPSATRRGLINYSS